MVATHAAPADGKPGTRAGGSTRSMVSGGALVGVAGVALNGLAALVPVVAARPLLPDEFGALSALLAVGTVAAVVGAALQTALAVRWSHHETVAGAGRVALLTAGLATGALVAAVPLLAVALDLHPGRSLLLAVLTCPVVLAGRWLGELQGRQRYGRLAAGLTLLGLGRYGGLLVALIAGLGVTAALAVGALTAWLALGALAVLTGRSTAVREDQPAGERVAGREVLRAGGATIAMLAISYADLIVARALLTPDDAGAYAVGSVLTKGALWAPGVLTVLALPHFARARRHAVRITLFFTGACGAVLVLASALFGDVAMRIAGGTKYDHLGSYATGFAALGGLYALVFVIVNAEIAKLVRRPALWLWVALAGIAAAALIVRPTTMGGVLVLAIVTATVTLAVTTATFTVQLRRWRIADAAAGLSEGAR